MPHFDSNGNETWVCQKGGHICTGESHWVERGSALSAELGCHGNVCHRCFCKPTTPPKPTERNVVYWEKKTHIKTVMSAYSNDVYEKLPFRCDSPLSNKEIEIRIAGIVYKKCPPSHWGGCGYSCSVTEIHRETPTTGYAVLMHYNGIGD
jgi:hypothetical protein